MILSAGGLISELSFTLSTSSYRNSVEELCIYNAQLLIDE